MRSVRVQLVALCVVAAAAVPVLPAAAAGGPYDQTVNITFPTEPRASFGHDYHDPRSGGRVHKATDLMGRKMWKLYAAVDGVICMATGIDEPMPSWGYSLTVCGTDGRRYRYIHINNDTPGTDDGRGGVRHAYAPGVREGLRVARGQFIGYMGDSGNAEGTSPHLHFEIHDETVTDPYDDHRIDPYASLRAALARGDIADGSAFYADPVDRVAGRDRIGTAIAISRQVFQRAEAAVIARSDAPGPAIIAGPLADALGGPVLTVKPGLLDERVVAELRRLGTGRVTLVGGVGAGVADRLGALGLQVDAIAGGDQFETSALVAERVWELHGATGGGGGDGLSGDAVDGEAPIPGIPVIVARAGGDTVALDGARVAGEIRVAVEGIHDVDHVDLSIDGHHVNTEQREPYELLGGGSFDTDRVGDGSHTLTAEVTFEDGLELRLDARFEVVQGGSDRGNSRTAIVALGSHPVPDRAWPDSLVASWYGSVTDAPVLLVEHNRMPTGVAAALETADRTVVLGGDAAIRPDLFAEVTKRVDRVTRLAGPSRFSTAGAVAEAALQRSGVSDGRVWAATGANWPDAVAAGPAVAAAGDVLVLIDGAGTGRDADVEDWMSRHRDDAQTGRVLGGKAAVTDRALRNLARRIT